MRPVGYAASPAREPTKVSMTTNARPMTHCPSCGGKDLLTIGFGDAEGVLFRICPPCEARWWERDGDSLDLSAVLSLLIG